MENASFMGSYGICPLVMTNVAMENHHAVTGKAHYEWVIFNSEL